MLHLCKFSFVPDLYYFIVFLVLSSLTNVISVMLQYFSVFIVYSFLSFLIVFLMWYLQDLLTE